MPKRGRSQSAAPKKKPKTKSYGGSKAVSMPMYAPLKVSQPFVMRYYDVLTTVGTSTTSPAVCVMALNGMYDPNISLTGHQPRGFDEMMALYNKYTVKNATIRFSAASWSNGATIVGIHISNISSAFTSIEKYVEAGNTKYKVQGIAGAPIAEVSYSVNIAKFLGKKDDMDADLEGTASTNPDEILYAHVFYHEFTQSNSVTPPMNVEITYYGVVTEQKVPNQS